MHFLSSFELSARVAQKPEIPTWNGLNMQLEDPKILAKNVECLPILRQEIGSKHLGAKNAYEVYIVWTTLARFSSGCWSAYSQVSAFFHSKIFDC